MVTSINHRRILLFQFFSKYTRRSFFFQVTDKVDKQYENESHFCFKHVNITPDHRMFLLQIFQASLFISDKKLLRTEILTHEVISYSYIEHHEISKENVY